MFEKVTGNKWDKFDGLDVDPEKKITEFDYEEFIHQDLLKDTNT